MLAEAEEVDAAEDAGHDGGGQPPAALRARADRLRRLAHAKAQLDAQDAAAAQAHAQHLQRRAAVEAEQARKLRGRKPKSPVPNAEAHVVFVGSGTRPRVGVPMVLISGRLAAERIVSAARRPTC
jgi:hypothetical protein